MVDHLWNGSPFTAKSRPINVQNGGFRFSDCGHSLRRGGGEGGGWESESSPASSVQDLESPTPSRPDRGVDSEAQGRMALLSSTRCSIDLCPFDGCCRCLHFVGTTARVFKNVRKRGLIVLNAFNKKRKIRSSLPRGLKIKEQTDEI